MAVHLPEDGGLDAVCADLADPDMAQFGVSLFICVGILVSYLPQHYTLLKRRSSEGISPYFILLGTTSLNFALASILAMPASRDALACCRVNSGLSCAAGALGIVQIAVQWACFWLILLLWLLYFPRATPLAPPLEGTPAERSALGIALICGTHALVMALANLGLTARQPDALGVYASAAGAVATVLAVTQYLPQLWTTWRLKTVGSLSIPMMCIQTPGSYVWAASLAVRLGPEGWGIWGLYVATGTLQGCILVLGIVYELRNRREKRARADAADRAEWRREGADDEEEIRDESTPLIGATS